MIVVGVSFQADFLLFSNMSSPTQRLKLLVSVTVSLAIPNSHGHTLCLNSYKSTPSLLCTLGVPMQFLRRKNPIILRGHHTPRCSEPTIWRGHYLTMSYITDCVILRGPCRSSSTGYIVTVTPHSDFCYIWCVMWVQVMRSRENRVSS